MNSAVVTGATSQSGVALCRLLKREGIRVIAGVRNPNHPFMSEIEDYCTSVQCYDLDDLYSTQKIISGEQPDYFFNCAAASFVGSSNKFPELHFKSNVQAILRQLEALRNSAPNCRYVAFGSAEQFGGVKESPQNEKTPPCPINFYGVSKVCSHEYIKMYRNVYGMYAVQNWSYNFESKWRTDNFVWKKIANGLKTIKKNIQKGEKIQVLELGNIYACRDFSHVEDIAQAYWLTANNEKPKDYVIGSGESMTILGILNLFIEKLGLDLDFCYNEYSSHFSPVFKYKGQIAVESVQKFYRTNDAEHLIADSSLIKKELGWKPQKTVDDIVSDLV